MNEEPSSLKETPLAALHHRLRAHMVSFAGYTLPLHYSTGIISEHWHTRVAAGLFDISHMGQGRVDGPEGTRGAAAFQAAAIALEHLVPGDIVGLKPGRIRYTVFTNQVGGILDDLMVTHAGDHLLITVNAARREADFAYIQATIGDRIRFTELRDQALLALQGPQSAVVMERLVPDALFSVANVIPFMGTVTSSVSGISCQVSRSGYTGDDGFELSISADQALSLAEHLLAEPEVWPVGLGARDSLRLEAGLCLYGSDIDITTSLLQANLSWVISQRRWREANFPGANILLTERATGSVRSRVGLVLHDRVLARASAVLTDISDLPIGVVTSGSFSPVLDKPIAMGYVTASHTSPGTPVKVMIRGTLRGAEVVAMPFVPHRYHKG